MSFSTQNSMLFRHGNNDIAMVRPYSTSGTYTPAGYGAFAFGNTSNVVGVYLTPTAAGTLAVRTAAHGDANLTCGAITASGAIQETPTQSSLNPTTTDIPSGKRMGWYNTTLGEFRDWVNIGGTLLKSAVYT
jgi:hypothetical protein